ncbi:hypothetical protein [Coleofasciculus sp. FACHB-129]|uniref:hypothetical protein n=1 Tax=Cyanophyceae TaxID=3028117 RepID=UPI001689E8AD|nr:hypothetical protein [Coleofasciculus sp. FACHB-129]MBD1893088.1 hypothetical protein [Coleofasciculus sp. FACHB-129]
MIRPLNAAASAVLDDKPSVFKSLLDKAKTCTQEPEVELTTDLTIKPTDEPEFKQEELSEDRKVKRLKGRRSNPDYTLISAYVLLELYLDVQAELLKEGKSKRQPSAVDVSTLVEQLSHDWLKNRKGE